MATRHQRTQAISAYVIARKTADRVLDRTALSPVMGEYDRQVGEAMLGMGRTFRGVTRELVTPAAVEKAMGWFQGWFGRFLERMGVAFGGTTRETLESGWGATNSLIEQMRGSRVPYAAGTEMQIVSGHLQMIQELRAGSLRALGTGIQQRVLDEFAKTLRDPEIRVSDMITKAGEVLDGDGWKVDRMVRTETSYAYNAAQEQAISAIGRIPGFGEVWGRWTERVNDMTGAPFDARVAADSMALHGQLAKTGGLFIMPSAPNVKADMIGKGWHHPPNRPNDRAVLTPWMRDWGVQGWLMQNGSRITF